MGDHHSLALQVKDSSYWAKEESQCKKAKMRPSLVTGAEKTPATQSFLGPLCPLYCQLNIWMSDVWRVTSPVVPTSGE